MTMFHGLSQVLVDFFSNDSCNNLNQRFILPVSQKLQSLSQTLQCCRFDKNLLITCEPEQSLKYEYEYDENCKTKLNVVLVITPGCNSLSDANLSPI